MSNRSAASPGAPLDASSELSRWHELIAGAGERPVRVVVLADSMGENSFGFRGVWSALHRAVTLTSQGAWFPPRMFHGKFGWTLLTGEPAEIGIDGRGQLLRSGDGPAGTVPPAWVPSTLDLYYTARPDGAPLVVRVDGDVVGEIDTSRDEAGRAVTTPVVAQRWRSSMLGRVARWEIEASGPGVAAVEASCTPPVAGIELHGSGCSGRPTRRLLDGGWALGHLRAMSERGEPPDLVVWAADTAELDADVQRRAMEEALVSTRRILPGSVVAHYLPTGRSGWDDSEERIAELRAIDHRLGVVVLDGHGALGDVSRGARAERYADDGVHLNAEGQGLLDRECLSVLTPPGLEPVQPERAWSEAIVAAGERPVRVVLLAEPDVATFPDLEETWETIHRRYSEEPIGDWTAPVPDDDRPAPVGQPVEAGLDGLGVLLGEADGPLRPLTDVVVPTALDLYYTARPGGAVVEVGAGGAVERVDTSLDEWGRKVAAPRPAQRRRVHGTSGPVRWQVEVVGSGTAVIEGIDLPPRRGLHVQGSGCRGSTGSTSHEGAVAHIAAMVARGEPPDLIVWAFGASGSEEPVAELARIGDALNRIRHIAHTATILQCLPPFSDGSSHPDLRAKLLRGVAEGIRAVLVEVEGTAGASPSPGGHVPVGGLGELAGALAASLRRR